MPIIQNQTQRSAPLNNRDIKGNSSLPTPPPQNPKNQKTAIAYSQIVIILLEFMKKCVKTLVKELNLIFAAIPTIIMEQSWTKGPILSIFLTGLARIFDYCSACLHLILLNVNEIKCPRSPLNNDTNFFQYLSK